MLIVAMMWLTIGSLVNFHMNLIFGKQLISQTLYCQRQKDKSLKELKNFGGVSRDIVPQPAGLPQPEMIVRVRQTPSPARYSDQAPQHIQTAGRQQHGLRAPPVA